MKPGIDLALCEVVYRVLDLIQAPQQSSFITPKMIDVNQN
jgi:hypothetical protein